VSNELTVVSTGYDLAEHNNQNIMHWNRSRITCTDAMILDFGLASAV